MYLTSSAINYARYHTTAKTNYNMQPSKVFKRVPFFIRHIRLLRIAIVIIYSVVLFVTQSMPV